MSDEKDTGKPEGDDEPITAGPWSRRAAFVILLRWTENRSDGTARPREKAFATVSEAGAFKRDLESKGFDVVIA